MRGSVGDGDEVALVGAELELGVADEDERAEFERGIVRDRHATGGCGKLEVIEIAESGVDVLFLPKLSHGEEGVLEARDTTNVGEAETYVLALSVLRDNWKRADGGAPRDVAVSLAEYFVTRSGVGE